MSQSQSTSQEISEWHHQTAANHMHEITAWNVFTNWGYSAPTVRGNTNVAVIQIKCTCRIKGGNANWKTVDVVEWKGKVLNKGWVGLKEERRGPAESEQMEKQTAHWLSAAKEREKGMFNTLYASLLVSLFPNMQRISNPSPLSCTHIHTRSRQAEDGNYEHWAAARQRERNDQQKENIQ